MINVLMKVLKLLQEEQSEDGKTSSMMERVSLDVEDMRAALRFSAVKRNEDDWDMNGGLDQILPPDLSLPSESFDIILKFLDSMANIQAEQVQHVEEMIERQALQTSKMQLLEMNIHKMCDELAEKTHSSNMLSQDRSASLSEELLKFFLLQDSLNLALVDLLSNLACLLQQGGGSSSKKQFSSSPAASTSNLQLLLSNAKKRASGLDAACLQQRRQLLSLLTPGKVEDVSKLGLNVQDCWTGYLMDACDVIARVTTESEDHHADRELLVQLQSENQLLREMIKQLEVFRHVEMLEVVIDVEMLEVVIDI
eukprot:751679-Hanusia_phi.AAC.2